MFYCIQTFFFLALLSFVRPLNQIQKCYSSLKILFQQKFLISQQRILHNFLAWVEIRCRNILFLRRDWKVFAIFFTIYFLTGSIWQGQHYDNQYYYWFQHLINCQLSILQILIKVFQFHTIKLKVKLSLLFFMVRLATINTIIFLLILKKSFPRTSTNYLVFLFDSTKILQYYVFIFSVAKITLLNKLRRLWMKHRYHFLRLP